MNGAAVGGVLCAVVFAVGVGTLVGAVMLRAAAALYNKFAGGASSPSAVPEPDFGKAAQITFVTMLANWGVSFVIGLAMGGATSGTNHGELAAAVGQFVSGCIGLLVMAGMLAAMLPTTFPRALLVTLCYLLIGILVAIVIGGFIVVGALAIGR